VRIFSVANAPLNYLYSFGISWEHFMLKNFCVKFNAAQRMPLLY